MAHQCSYLSLEVNNSFMKPTNHCPITLYCTFHGCCYNPYVAIIIMGISYSLLASALWPIAALIIPEHQLGTAYGNANFKTYVFLFYNRF